MEKQEPIAVPFFVYESAMEKSDRQQKRLVALIGVLIGLVVLLSGLLFLSNMLWLKAWNSYDYTDDYSIDVDAGEGGTANYIGKNGDITNGTNNSTEKAEQNA